MITLIGTGHVFRIAEPVSFIVKNIWPDAVLVELDEKRYGALRAPPSEDREKSSSWAYRNTAEYQKAVAEENGSQVGAEFEAAVETGRTIGAAIEFIDKDAAETMNEAFGEMPFREKARFMFSMIGDRFRPKKKAQTAVEEFAENEEKYFEDLRKRYPTLVRKLIDERNAYMADRINEASKKYGNMIAVVGDGHVEGIAGLLAADASCIRKIRLKTLMSTEQMNALRAELWSGNAPDSSSEGIRIEEENVNGYDRTPEHEGKE